MYALLPTATCRNPKSHHPHSLNAIDASHEPYRVPSAILEDLAAVRCHLPSRLLLLERIVDVVLLRKQVSLDLGVLQQLEVTFYIAALAFVPLQSRAYPKSSHFSNTLNEHHHVSTHSSYHEDIPLKCPHFSKWFTPSLR